MTASLEGYNKYEKSGITFAEGSIVENIALEPIVPTVSGVVTDAATNEPIEGVQVMMQSGGVIFFGMTDAEGHYSFEVTETGLAYTLTAYVAGYKTYTEENVSVAEVTLSATLHWRNLQSAVSLLIPRRTNLLPVYALFCLTTGSQNGK